MSRLSEAQVIYRCFHCKQDIVGEQEALMHFGREPTAKPECWMYPRNMKDILHQNSGLRWFAENFFHGIDSGLVHIDTDADETLANVLTAARAALASRAKED
jgi:hypothetical protein